MSEETTTTTTTKATELLTPAAQEGSDFNAGGFFMLYKNEEDQAVRQFAVDFASLNEQAQRENFTKETYSGVLYGFESAVRIILGNYNIAPRTTPVDSLSESQRLTVMFEEALAAEEAKQKQLEETTKSDAQATTAETTPGTPATETVAG